jgi:hypothetical protein
METGYGINEVLAMPKFRERFEAKMTEWINSGKSEIAVFSVQYDQMCAYLWAISPARKTEEFSEEIISFGRANIQALGDDQYNKMLRIREHCSGCGETYRLENLSIQQIAGR